MNICAGISALIDYGIRNKLISDDDVFVVRNTLMDILRLSEWEDCSADSTGKAIDDILAPLVGHACAEGIIGDTAVSRDLFDTRLMGVLTPMPREVISDFREHYKESPETATDRYYRLSEALNYVRAGRIARDLKWTFECEYGTLDITINRSKPEKDPRDIAAARMMQSASYPLCQLCAENAGFAGHAGHPARQNLRPVPMTVGGEEWQLQYSPYGYYREHCIVFNRRHVPMKIDSAVFGKLFDSVDYLPHYFIGSNADLPIVGGSILSHEHFQGGRFDFAMAKAPVEQPLSAAAYPGVEAGIVRWPMSVIRLTSADRAQLERCCAAVLDNWRKHTDSTAGIYAQTDGEPHNTVTPIARMRGGRYECDLVLRCNITSSERPLGVFHPRPSLHHIKKENIGLIEVMGLAVLPARLADELSSLERAMLVGEDIGAIPSLSHHGEWALGILERHPEFCRENARTIIESEVGSVFLQVLEDAGVFKRSEAGRSAFLRFAQCLDR